MVEQMPLKHPVTGSNPVRLTTYLGFRCNFCNLFDSAKINLKTFLINFVSNPNSVDLLDTEL